VRQQLQQKEREVSELSERLRQEEIKTQVSAGALEASSLRITDLWERCKCLEESVALEERQMMRFSEVEKMVVQVDYILEDIKTSIVTTDTFIDFYLPHKLNKFTLKILQQLFSADPAHLPD